MGKRSKQSAKVLKKFWFPLVAPKIFRNATIGEMHLYEIQEALGRKATVNLMTLTNDMKKQGININFTVESVEGKNIHTAVVGYRMASSSIKRLVRKGKNRIDMSFVIKTKDEKLVRVKPFLVTFGSATSSTLKAVKRRYISEITKITKTLTFEELIQDMISTKLQIHLKNVCRKVFPLKISDVRAAYLTVLKKKYVEGAVEEEPAKDEDDAAGEPEAKQEEVKEQAVTKPVVETSPEEKVAEQA